jgi:plasmid replication initiation protein
MNHQNLTVCKANKVIEAGYKLSLNEQRVILACIAQVNSTEELLKTNRFELSAKDFSALFGISQNRAYSELQEVAKQLFHRYVIIDNPDPEQPKLKRTQTHWISSIDYIPDDGKIVLFFAHKILPYLGELKGQFTRYELKHIGNMTSIYGIRLYELLMQWKTMGKREIEIDWLKKQFLLDESYERMYDLKKYVIAPAIKDINKYSNFNVAWEQRKTGRRVTHLIFTFAEKQPTPEKPKRTTTPTKETPEKPKRTLKQSAKIHNAVDLMISLKSGLASQKAIEALLDNQERESTRLEVIKAFVSSKKPDLLKEFEQVGFVTSKAFGTIIEPDLRAAGLFD